jgi:hypothetical protein
MSIPVPFYYLSSFVSIHGVGDDDDGDGDDGDDGDDDGNNDDDDDDDKILFDAVD